MLRWKRNQAIAIRMNGGEMSPFTSRGEVAGIWAIHKRLLDVLGENIHSSYFISLTHVPSGMEVLTRITTAKRLKALAARLNNIPGIEKLSYERVLKKSWKRSALYAAIKREVNEWSKDA